VIDLDTIDIDYNAITNVWLDKDCPSYCTLCGYQGPFMRYRERESFMETPLYHVEFEGKNLYQIGVCKSCMAKDPKLMWWLI